MICSCWILQRFFRHQELMAVSETAKARPALADADELLAAFDELERDLALPRAEEFVHLYPRTDGNYTAPALPGPSERGDA
jgi:hypothetical protein